MRTCSRCQASTPSGLRFCNYCGARLGDASAADLVFGNLALDPGNDSHEAQGVPHFQPPRNLRSLPASSRTPLDRARKLALSLAGSLPGQAAGLATAATQLAARTASRVANAVAGALPEEDAYRSRGVQPLPAPPVQVAPPTPFPAAPAAPVSPAPVVNPGEVSQLHPDLQAAYKTYLQGRQAYARGDRKLAARLFVGALRQSPPGSPLGEFLRRVLRPKGEAAPTAPVAVAPDLQHPRERANSPAPKPARETARESVRVLSGGLDVARTAPASRTPVGVASPRHEGQDLEQRRRRARQQAQELWFRNLPSSSPNRPSFLLDEADGGRDLEKVAGFTLACSAIGFLLLLFL